VETKSEPDFAVTLDEWLQSSSTVAKCLANVLPKADMPEGNGKRHSNPHWAKLPLFDRKAWQTVQFGDVVENVNETERAPAKAGIERFIGLEHLEPWSLHIRTWGNVADGTTFTRRCRPGQVLFGKRRAYQRKVAVAEFDAVVSGDIYSACGRDFRRFALAAYQLEQSRQL
jgi:hypothetical protein